MRYTISFAAASLASGLTVLPAMADVPNVVTDFTPANALVAQVMGDLGTPEMLLDQGASAHNFQLRPSQARALANADLVVWIGPDMTGWMATALNGPGAGVSQLALMAVPGTHLQEYQPHGMDLSAGGDDHDHDHDHGHDHDHEGHDHDHAGHEEGHDHGDHADHAGHDHGDHATHDHDHDHAHDDHDHSHDHAHHGHDHDHDGHSHTGTDPHAWLTPENAPVWLAAIAAELSVLDPDNAAIYAANAEAAAASYAVLDQELAELLAPVQDRPFVVAHDAYGYMVSHYGLNVAGSVQLGDATTRGAAGLSDLRQTLQSGGVACIFPEVAHDPKQAEMLIEGTSVRLGAQLDPAGATLEPGPEALEALLRNMATSLADCLTE